MNRGFVPGFRQIPPVVKNLLIINILMLFAKTVVTKFGIDLDDVLGLHHISSEYFEPYQFVTHVFMHGGLMHLVFNMFALWMFGKILEGVWGSKRFFIYYMVTGLGAALLHSVVVYFSLSGLLQEAQMLSLQPTPEAFEIFVKEHFAGYYPQISDFIEQWLAFPENPAFISKAVQFTNELVAFKLDVPTVGASGAVFGVLLAFGMLFPNTELMLLFPPIPIKAKYFVMGYGAIELYLGIMQRSGDNVAHWAHLGGMIFGFFLIKFWNKSNNTFY